MCLHNEPVELCEVRVREPLQQHELALEVDGRALGPKVMRPPRLMQLAQQLQTPPLWLSVAGCGPAP